MKTKFKHAHVAKLFGVTVKDTGTVDEQATHAGKEVVTVSFKNGRRAHRVPADLFNIESNKVEPIVAEPVAEQESNND